MLAWLKKSKAVSKGKLGCLSEKCPCCCPVLPPLRAEAYFPTLYPNTSTPDAYHENSWYLSNTGIYEYGENIYGPWPDVPIMAPEDGFYWAYFYCNWCGLGDDPILNSPGGGPGQADMAYTKIMPTSILNWHLSKNFNIAPWGNLHGDNLNSYTIYESNEICPNYEGKIKFNYPYKPWLAGSVDWSETYKALEAYSSTGPATIDGTIELYLKDAEAGDNPCFSYDLPVRVPDVIVVPCFTGIDPTPYSIVSYCDYTELDCGGCLYSARIKAVPDSKVQHIVGCHNLGLAELNVKSTKVTFLNGPFDSQQDANDYRSENYGSLMASVYSSCAGRGWVIVGTCDCSDSECAECQKGSVSVICEDKMPEECVLDDEGNRTKTVRLYDGSFPRLYEASDYLSDNNATLNEDLESACSTPTLYCRISVTYNCGSEGWEKSSAGGSCEAVEEPDTAGTWEGTDYESATYSIDIEDHCPDDCQAFAENYDPGDPPYECYDPICPDGTYPMSPSEQWGSSCGEAKAKFNNINYPCGPDNLVSFICEGPNQFDQYVVIPCCRPAPYP